MTLQSAGASVVEYLEAWPPYIERWRDGDFPIQLGDVRVIDEIYSDDAFDCVLWIHGPEHVAISEWSSVFRRIDRVAKRATLFAMPMGPFYDDQAELNGNPHETHVVKSITPEMLYPFSDYQVCTFSRPGAGDAQVVLMRFKG